MSQSASIWLAEAVAVYLKEWRCELRTRYALNTLGLFAFTTLVVVSLSLGAEGVLAAGPSVLSVLLWILLLFAVTAGLPRGFVHEEETHTATALRLAATPSALFCGKLAYNASVVLLLQLLLTPLFLIMMQLSVEKPVLLIWTLLAGGYGLAAGGTLVAAIIAQARTAGTLFAVLALPVLLPLLVMAIDLTEIAVLGKAGDMAMPRLLLYDGTVTVVSLMLFPAIWNP